MAEENPSQKVTYIGKIDYRNKELTFGIKARDRTMHTYIIGKSGMGKSTLIENLVFQDINNGEGVCFIDPHGSTAEKILDYIPESRIKDVIYFAPFDGEYPMGLNMLEKVPAEKRYLLANGMMSAFKKIFTDGDGKGTFSARMEYVLNNIILALLENDGQTLLGVNRMLFDKEYRKFIVSNVTDPTVKDFWVNEYANYTDKTAQELAPAIQNKIGQFVSNPLIRNIIGQKKTSFDVRKIMDEKKIFIANLSKGKVGEGNANLLGSLLITKIYLSAMSRADIDPYLAEKLPPCYFYVDEFQNFANESFASILSEARKYKLALTVAHQYVEQMTDEVKSAVFGNVGTMITFRVGATDAEVFEKEFAPYFILDDFVNLSAFQIYIRLLIDSQGSKPFSARTLPPIQKPAQSHAAAVITYSRANYAKPRFMVEEEIMDFYKPVPKPEKKKEEYVQPDVKQLKVNDYKTYSQAPQSQQQRNEAPKRYESPKKFYNEPKQAEVAIDRGPSARPVHDSAPSGQVTLPGNKPVSSSADSPSGSRKEVIAEIVQSKEEIKTEVFVKQEEKPIAPSSEIKTDTQVTKRDFSSPQKPYQQTKPEGRQQPRPALHFDDKPAMSLKEALAKALLEQSVTPPAKVEEPKKEIVEEVVEKKEIVKEEVKKRKEIAEDVLRKLIEEE